MKGGRKERGGRTKKNHKMETGGGKKKKKKGWISNAAIQQWPDDLGLVALPSAASVWPVNVPPPPVKHNIPASLHTEGQPSSPRAPETQSRRTKEGKRGSRGGKEGVWRRAEAGRGKGVTFSPTAHLHALLLLSMY